MKRRGKLYVISGPSGAGKGTIVRRILEDRGDIALSISMTTRQPRPGEVDGVHYFFVSKESFLETVDAGGLLEHAEVYGNYYGTPRQKVMDRLEAGTDVILEIDIQGALNVKKAFPEAVLLFIVPPSMEVLRRRLTDRKTDSAETIELRLSKTRGELTHLKEYDFCVVNDDLDEAVREAEAVIEAGHYRVDGQRIADILENY